MVLINNIPVAVYGDDFTIRGGAADAAIWEKMISAEKLANDYEIPIIRLIEGTGGGGSVNHWKRMVILMYLLILGGM